MAGSKVLVHYLQPTQTIPNSKLPLLIYRNALAPGPNMASEFERIFKQSGWNPQAGFYLFINRTCL